MEAPYDIILIGGGCSAMQWLRVFLEQEEAGQQQVLVVDKDQAFPDRTWCFWSNKPHGYENIVTHSWSKIRFASPWGETMQDVSPYRYHYVSGRHFFEAASKELLSKSNVHRITDTVQAVHQVNGQTEVHGETGQYSAKYVLSSVPSTEKLRNLSENKPLVKLWQHFRGWFIKTSEAAFDPEEVMLMDFRTPQRDGAVFFYVLPFTADYALVECTVFGQQIWDQFAYEEALRTYIRTYITTKDYEIKDTEEGRIPMSQRDFSRLGFDGTQALGTAAGNVKPSTGYMFLRSLRHVQQQFGAVPAQSVPPRFAFYDALLLRIIEESPEEVSRIMHALFTRNPFQHVFRFLDEESRLTDDIRMFATLPWRPFLKQLFKKILQPNKDPL
ncbi:lycopene beta-cyclase [Cyclonatronum proteinivorum]|uniref:Lycopene beta-cyclase n=1 Tax=Cyclonatronum proteinivorum TaxID=1457365 RepID=A0A345UGT8_9BACT|nr:lycopene cyclase family protein [Cyclonatronum proteinivorum]AXI99689.1 lycopene beta-cyclase [Cyclonatronum proteinivorum]